MPVSNDEHCRRSRCARSGRKQVSRSLRNRTGSSEKRSSPDVSAGLLFFWMICLCLFFRVRYMHSRIERTRTLAIIPSAMIRARVTVLRSLSRSLMRLPPFILSSLSSFYSSFHNFSLSNSLLFPTSTIVRVFLTDR